MKNTKNGCESWRYAVFHGEVIECRFWHKVLKSEKPADQEVGGCQQSLEHFVEY